MVVRIRLARFGCKNRPFYRVMAADSRSPRDGKHLEVLGYYNPLPGQDGGKRMGLNFDRVKYWLSVGAQPSDPVQRILFRAGMLPPTPMMAMARKGGPRDTRPVDPMSGRILATEKPASDDQAKDAAIGEEKEAGTAEVNDGLGRLQETIFHIGLQDKQHGIDQF
ncbi:PREDICTED: 37S ribosomal protein S16, mitochondrial [Fragaria vesca subsp. vesca]|uniref:37S ribosomal protein S16, mitochondrial n=1 Tax=Fragaria vesca subsp. vesca TaxID=101020 RepID=UPI0002C312F7|nr:PREDICTED: 37S ribosomal protein S16, mitochondrial [Fragaria vesca subsp. vesca]